MLEFIEIKCLSKYLAKCLVLSICLLLSFKVNGVKKVSEILLCLQTSLALLSFTDADTRHKTLGRQRTLLLTAHRRHELHVHVGPPCSQVP